MHTYRRSGFRRNPLRQPCAYVLANKRSGTLYIGATSNIIQRVWQHKNDFVPGFIRQHSIHRLVWYEALDRMESVITREKAIKGWKRAWKIELIEKSNSKWRDLYNDLA